MLRNIEAGERWVPAFRRDTGKRRKISKRQAVVTELVNESVGANLRATKILIDDARGAPLAAVDLASYL